MDRMILLTHFEVFVLTEFSILHTHTHTHAHARTHARTHTHTHTHTNNTKHDVVHLTPLLPTHIITTTTHPHSRALSSPHFSERDRQTDSQTNRQRQREGEWFIDNSSL